MGVPTSLQGAHAPFTFAHYSQFTDHFVETESTQSTIETRVVKVVTSTLITSTYLPNSATWIHHEDQRVDRSFIVFRW